MLKFLLDQSTCKREVTLGETSLLSVTDQAQGVRSVQTAAQHCLLINPISGLTRGMATGENSSISISGFDISAD